MPPVWRSTRREVHRSQVARQSGAFIKKRSVGDWQASQLDDHGLEIEEGFEAALCDLGLIRRVLCVPTGIFKEIPLDHSGSDAIVIAHPDVGTKNLVLGGESA